MSVRGLCLVLLGLAAAPASAGPDTADRPRHVLLLHSYEREYAPHGQVAQIIQKELSRQSLQPINFFDVSLQPARASTNPDEAATLEYLQSTFAGRRLDLIISIGGPAARFAVDHREHLFASTPLLLAGADRHFVATTPMPVNTAAIAISTDAPPIIATALALLPDTTTVHVVLGTSALEQFWRSELSRQLHEFKNRLTFRWFNSLSFGEMLTRSGELPPNSIVFFTLFSVDADGVPHVEERTLRELHARANAPIFGFHSGQLGQGIVGGPLLSIEEIGEKSTQAALRILGGEAPASVATPTIGMGIPTFDARELRRWGIAEARLPPGSIVRFREPTVWQQYRWQIVGGTAFALFQTSLVVALLTIQVKRRRAERAQRESEARFRLLADSAPAMVWMSGPDGRRTDFNRGWLEFTGRTIEQEGGIDGWLQGVHAGDFALTLQTCSQAFDRREPFRIEYRLRRHDGEHRWILDTGLPRFDANGVFAGHIGSCIDVTDLKLAKAALASLSHKLMQSQEGERTLIAKELHEDLGQRLAGLTMQLHSLSRVSIDDNLRTRVGDLCAQFGDLGRDIQAISGRLYSYKLEYLGLAAAVGAMCQEAARQHAVEIDFSHDGVPHDLPREVALGLFHVLQQAIDNAVLHSGSRDIAVDLRACTSIGLGMATDVIQLKVIDHGMGFDPEDVARGDGLGLIHMRERMNLVNGELLVESHPGAGTKIIARVPFTAGAKAGDAALPLDAL
jgi:PAS domain S-box-containing protein